MGYCAIIGGSGLTQFDDLVEAVAEVVSTVYGDAYLVKGKLAGTPVIFMPRHGPQHGVPPHKINYRANLAALQAQGVTDIIAINAVGGIHPQMSPGALAVPHQIIDYSYSREHTFRDGNDGIVDHIDFTAPYTEALRELIIAEAGSAGYAINDFGVYACTQGPRLETAAEIKRLAQDGCDLVGMTGMPEAALARELGLGYASICVVANWGAGITTEPLTMTDIIRVITEKMSTVRALLVRLVPKLGH